MFTKKHDRGKSETMFLSNRITRIEKVVIK